MSQGGALSNTSEFMDDAAMETCSSLALSAQYLVSDMNLAYTDEALMYKWSFWRMKAVGGKRT